MTNITPDGLVIVAVALYFVPALIALGRRGATAIIVVNVLLGWTVLGWFAALIAALVAPKSEAKSLGDFNTLANLGEHIAAQVPNIWTSEVSDDRGSEEKGRWREVEVHGESQINEDGSSRQEIIGRLHKGDEVFLVREPRNPYDHNAIRVVSRFGTVGYIAAKAAMELAPLLDEHKCKTTIQAIADGDRERPTKGVLLDIAVGEPAA